MNKFQINVHAIKILMVLGSNPNNNFNRSNRFSTVFFFNFFFYYLKKNGLLCYVRNILKIKYEIEELRIKTSIKKI
jgi:hypothetical protein